MNKCSFKFVCYFFEAMLEHIASTVTDSDEIYISD